MNTSLHSPPRPLLLSETPFSQRKRTPFRAPQPPRAPAKSCPPVSRVFHTPLFANTGPHFVSFKSERKSDGKEQGRVTPIGSIVKGSLGTRLFAKSLVPRLSQGMVTPICTVLTATVRPVLTPYTKEGVGSLCFLLYIIGSKDKMCM